MTYTYFGQDADGFYGDREDGARVRFTTAEFLAVVNPRPREVGDTLEISESHVVAKFDGEVPDSDVPEDPTQHPRCVEVIRMGTVTTFRKVGSRESAPEIIYRRANYHGDH